MKLSRFFIFILLVSNTSLTFSQNLNEPVEVEKLKDQAEEVNYYRVVLPFYELNLSSTNLSIYNLNFGFVGQFKDKMMLSAIYTYSLADRMNATEVVGGSTLHAVSIYESSHANALDFDFTYYFSKSVSSKDMRIRLKGNSRVEYVTYVQGQEMLRYGLRLGFTKGYTWYSLSDLPELVGTDKSGNDFTMDFQDKSSTMNYTNLRIGVCRSKQTNLHVLAKGYGYRNNTGLSYLYADALISLNNKLDDIYGAYAYNFVNSENTIYYKQYDIDSNLEKSKIGFALGGRVYPFTGAFSVSAEGGIFPAVKGASNGYLKLGANLTFGTSESMKKQYKD